MEAKPPDQLFTVGRVLGYWGRKGMVKVKPLTDFPERLPLKGSLWLWDARNGARFLRLREGRLQGGHVLLGFEGVATISQAEALKGALVMVDEGNLEPLPDGAYYHHQIIGLEVRREDGARLGKIEEIFATGAHDVYVIRQAGAETLVPAVRDFIVKIDLREGIMIVRLPPEETGEGIGA